MPSPVRYVIFTVLLIFLFTALFYHNYDTRTAIAPIIGSADQNQVCDCEHTKETGSVSLQHVLQFIYNPSTFSATTPVFDDGKKTYNLPHKPLHSSSLGKDVCILDVDTRAFDSNDQIFHESDFDWKKLEQYSGGILNHYTYARLHGYDYKFINAANYTDRNPTWIKPSAISNILASYKFVIFLDADASFQHMQIPVEWLLNYWSIDSSISLAMALDPPGLVNNDTYGRRYTNTGFIIAQNNPRTFEILKAWDECPSDKRYPGCSEWRMPRFHEQSAFGTYVRYDYDDFIMELPCDEANGEPDLELCRGTFISHFWWRTSQVKSFFGDYTLQTVMESLHQDLISGKKDIVQVQSDNKIYGTS